MIMKRKMVCVYHFNLLPNFCTHPVILHTDPNESTINLPSKIYCSIQSNFFLNNILSNAVNKQNLFLREKKKVNEVSHQSQRDRLNNSVHSSPCEVNQVDET